MKLTKIILIMVIQLGLHKMFNLILWEIQKIFLE